MALGPPRRVIALALLAAAACGCRKSGDPVEEAVRSLARSASARDASAVVSLLSPSFQAADGASRADVEREIRRLFSAYTAVDVRIADLVVDRFPDFALAKFRVEFRGTVRPVGGLESLLPPSARYRFELRFKPPGAGAKIENAFWEELR